MAEESELEKKKKSWRGIQNALDGLFSGKADGLLGSIIKDYTPNKPTGKTPSWKSLWEAIKFVVTNPIDTFNMVKLALSNPAIYQDADFQKEVLENQKLWDKVKQEAGGIPAVGKILDGFGIKEFSENGILDQKGLENICTVLKNDETLKDIKNIALTVISPNADFLKITSDALGLLAKDQNMTKYLQTNSKAISKYTTLNLTTLAQTDVIRTLDNITKDRKYDLAQTLLQSNPELKNQFTQIITNNLLTPEHKHIFDENPEFKKLTALQQDNLRLLSEETSSKTQPFLQEAYGIDKAKAAALAGIIPILLDSPKDFKTVFDGFKVADYTKMTTDLLSMVDKKPEIVKYFEDNRDIFVVVLNKTFENTPAIADLNLKGELYDIVPALLKHPKELTDIINIQNTGNYGEVAKKFIDLVQSDSEIQEYFKKKGSLLAQISTKTMEMEAYGIKDDEVGKIFERLMDKENTPKLQGILEFYQKGEWTKVITSTCDLIDKDPEFKQYMKDNKGNFAKIVTAVIDKSPQLKSYTNGSDVGHVASGILEDPKKIKDLVESYERFANSKGTIETAMAIASLSVAGTKIAMQNAGAMYDALSGWLSDADSAKQNLVNGIVQELSSVDLSDLKEPLKLNDFIKYSIAKSNLSEEKQAKVDVLVNRNILFDGVIIKGTKEVPLKLENLTIERNNFVNSTIENVSLKNTKFINVGFDGVKLKGVDFAGAEIDATTLKSMLNSVKKGKISLDETKITGDLSGVDLSGISLKGADLSKVSSMKDVNLKNTNLTDVKFPENHQILTDTYNLDKAVVTFGVIDAETIKEQQNKVVNKAVDQIASVAGNAGEKMEDEQKTRLGAMIKHLIHDGGSVGEYLQNGLSETPNDVINKNFPIKPEQLSHVAEYNGKTNNIMTILLENKNGDYKTISNAVAANLIADTITTNLFQEGQNRGADGLLIKEIMKQVVTKFTQENPSSDLNRSLETHEGQKLIEEISKELLSKTKYTTIGKVTGGIYLPQEAITESLVNKLKLQMNDSFGDTKFNEQELANIKTMADKIGKNLFGTGAAGNRKSDTKLIEQNLKDTFYQLKKENKGFDLSETISQQIEKMIGKVEKGYITINRTGLTELYYKNSTNTSAGMITGGIYLDEDIIGKKDFCEKMKQMVKDLGIKNLDSQNNEGTPKVQIQNSRFSSQRTR